MNRNQQQINQTAMLAGIVGQVGCLTIVLVGIALGAGILLDNLLGTRPLFTILLLVGSVPVTMYLTVRMSLSAVARANRAVTAESAPSEPSGAPAETTEEETLE